MSARKRAKPTTTVTEKRRRALRFLELVESEQEFEIPLPSVNTVTCCTSMECPRYRYKKSRDAMADALTSTQDTLTDGEFLKLSNAAMMMKTNYERCHYHQEYQRTKNDKIDDLVSSLPATATGSEKDRVINAIVKICRSGAYTVHEDGE